MPDIPWKTFSPPALDKEYLVMASSLPLRTRWRVPQFLMLTMAVRKQLATAPGLVGYGLRADILGGRFWTLSAWESEEALGSFARALPHSDIMRKLRPHMGPTQFVTWQATGTALPVTWETALAKLADARP